MQNISLIVTHGKKCHIIELINGNLLVREISELFSDHEEADTRMLLHASNASTVFKNVIIKTLYTEVHFMQNFLVARVGKRKMVSSHFFILCPIWPI